MTLLADVAHVRTGDKGDACQIAVIASDRAHYPLLAAALDGASLLRHLPALPSGVTIVRHELPALGALLFVLSGALAGGVTRSLALDAHGKTLGMQLLDLDLDPAEGLAR